MAPAHILWSFLLATGLFALIPGPAVLYTAAQTVARGRRAGFLAALGIHLGGYAYVAATALGLSALLAYVPSLYLAVKLAGAGYLIWLGVGMIRGDGAGDEAPDLPGRAARSERRAFLDSVGVELLNPKTAIFFVAFLPQFVAPAASLPVAAQFVVLGVAVNLMFSAVDVVTVLLASTVLRRLRAGGRGQRAARIAGGSVLVGLGARLAIESG